MGSLTESEFQEFIITMGYRYNEKAKAAFNTFEGFHNRIEFGQQENRYFVRMECGVKNGEPEDVLKELKEFQSSHKEAVLKVGFKKRCIVMELKETIDSDIDKEALKALVHFITELCKSDRLMPLCRVCGRERKTGVYVVGQEIMPICDSCVARKRRLYEKRRDLFEKKKQNLAAGILGALFGASLGALLNMLCYQFFPIKGIWSAFVAVLAFCGFVVTGKRATKKSGIITAIIAIVIFVISEYFAMVLETAILIEREGGGIAVSESIGIVNSGLMEQSYQMIVLSELTAGIAVILAVGAVYFLKRILTRPMKISKNLL